MDGFSFDWIDRNARFRPAAIALIDLPSGRRFTYRDLAERVDRLAGALAVDFAVTPGDRVAIAARNRADIFTLQFACWKLGAIFTPVNWRLSDPELKHLLRLAGPKLFISDTAIDGIDVPHRLHFPDLQDGFDGLVRSGDPSIEPHMRSTHDRVLTLLFTSGTTGTPKGVPYTERMILCSVLHAAAHAMVDADTRTLLIAPLFHSAGLFAATTTAFHFGGAVLVDNAWNPQVCLERFSAKDLGITHFNGVPTVFKQLSDLPGFQTADLSRLKMLGIGSAPISEDLLMRWKQKGVVLSQSYGLTEAFGVSITPMDGAEHYVGSAGLPMIHSDVRVVRDGRDTQAGEVGEIWVRGPSVMPHYWNDDEASAKEAFADGWFRTGDLAEQDERGVLYIVDRLKDMIISGGENIYPAEIEHVLVTHPAVGSAAVVGIPHDHWGETPVAIVEPHDGYPIAADDLRGFCLMRLAGFKVPTMWFESPSLALTAQGKFDKRLLRQAVLDHLGLAGARSCRPDGDHGMRRLV